MMFVIDVTHKINRGEALRPMSLFLQIDALRLLVVWSVNFFWNGTLTDNRKY